VSTTSAPKIERCLYCDSPTGRAGITEDSLYIGSVGPFCEECFEPVAKLQEELTDLRARCEKAERVLQEPTETMLQAGYEAVQYEVSDPYPHIGETVWRAMSEQFFKETAK